MCFSVPIPFRLAQCGAVGLNLKVAINLEDAIYSEWCTPLNFGRIILIDY